jgi:vacuolar-type H+-ATPase subunit I/STV1
MKRKLTCAFLVAVTLCSCGKSKEEIELEKAKIELETAKLQLLKKERKQEDQKINKIHEQKLNVGRQKKITELTQLLSGVTQSINEAERKISEIKKFKIGRAQSTKEQQLNKAYKELNEIRSYERRVKNEIAQLQYFKTFDFQKDPKTVMEYIFKSAKEGDFSNFRYLGDPYGENDSDVNQICYIEIRSDEKKQELKREFENGRVMGETKVKADRAEVEFAFGPSSNKLQTMKMVNRNGLWYLAAF